MADTVIGTGDPQARKIWSQFFSREVLAMTYMRRFMGTRNNSVLQMHRDMSQGRGDEVKYDLKVQLTGYGVDGDSVLKGNEQAMVYHQDSLGIDQKREGVSYRMMSQQRTIHDFPEDAREHLADWYARVYDQTWFAHLVGTAGDNAALDTAMNGFGGNAFVLPDADHTVDNQGSPFDLSMVRAIKEKAITASPKMRPIRTSRGEEVFVMFLSPYQVTSMKTATGATQWTEINASAEQRRSTNPVFTGALGMYESIVMHESQYLPTDLSGTGDWATPAANDNFGVLCGAQSSHIGFGNPYSNLGNPPASNQELFAGMREDDDYGNMQGYAVASIWGLKRAIFNSETYGSVAFRTTDVPAA